MADDQAFTEEELKLLAELGRAARDDPRPRLSTEEVRQSIQSLYEETMRERRRRA